MTVRIDGSSASRCSQRRDRDVVRQVGDQRGRLVRQVGRLQVKHVAVQHTEPVDLAVRVFGDGVRQLSGQHWVDLHGGDPRAAIQQRQRQRAEAGADFEDVVVAVDSGCRNHTAHGVCVVDKVLAEGLPRPKIELFGEMPYLGSTEQSNCQDVPNLPLHVGHAPQP